MHSKYRCNAGPLASVYHAHQFWLHREFPVRVSRLWPDPALVLAFSYGPVESVRLLMELEPALLETYLAQGYGYSDGFTPGCRSWGAASHWISRT